MTIATKQLRFTNDELKGKYELLGNQYIEVIDVWWDNIAKQWIFEATINYE